MKVLSGVGLNAAPSSNAHSAAFWAVAILSLPTACSEDPTFAATHDRPQALRAVSEVINFGRVVQGATYNGVFEIANVSAHDTVVTQIRSGCDCALTESWVQYGSTSRTKYEVGTPLRPRATLMLEVALRTAGKQGWTTATFDVATADGDILSLQMEGEVEPLFTVDPTPIELGVVGIGGGAEGLAVVRSPVLSRFVLRAAAGAAAASEIVLEPHDADAGGRASEWLVRVRFASSMREGDRLLLYGLECTEGLLRNDYNNYVLPPEPLSLKVFAKARVVTGVYADPDRLNFGRCAPRQRVERRLTIRPGPGAQLPAEPFQVKVIPAIGSEWLSEAVSWEFEPQEMDTLGLNVTLTIPSHADIVGPFRAQVQINAVDDHVSSSEVITTPLYGLIAR